MNRILSSILILAVVAIAGAWLLMRPVDTESGAFTLPGAALAQEVGDAAADADDIVITDFILGSADAPVTLVEYGSYTCPHCADFHENQFQQLKADYIDTGKVQFIFREFYRNRVDLWASMVARCGGEMRFYGIVDILLETQADWVGAGDDPNLIADNLRRIGISAGIDAAQIDACMADATTAEALVAKFTADAERDNVTGTPTLYLDGTKYSNMAYGDLASLIEDRLAAQ